MTTYYNAEFAAEFIVKRDPEGNWCRWNSGTGEYKSLITGLNNYVTCLAEAPDGKIYAGGAFTDAGADTDADYLARWDPIAEKWEAVVAGITGIVRALAFDANGDLYVGGIFINLGSTSGDCIVKITDINGTPTINALGSGITGTNYVVRTIAISENGEVYAGGFFDNAGGVSGAKDIAKWNGASWSALSTGVNDAVYSLKFSANGELYIGGIFTDTAYPYLCKWNGSAFSVVGTNTDINGYVYSLDFGANGLLYAGGEFTNAGGIASADHIACWNGNSWQSLETGTNDAVWQIVADFGRVYIAGEFTTAGGLTLTDKVAIWSNGAWQPLDIDFPGTQYVTAILPASDGSLYIGGTFSTVGEDPDENAVCGISYAIEVAELIEEDVDEADIDPVDGTGV